MLTSAPRALPPLAVGVSLAIGAVFFADFLTPLGIIVWIFYLGPILLCGLSRRPDAPLGAAVVVTVLMISTFFLDEPLIDPRVAQANRALGAVTLWAVAFVVRQLVLLRERLEREDRLRRAQMTVLEALQGEQTAAQIGQRALDILAERLSVQAGAAYVLDGGALSLAATHGLAGADGPPARLLPGEGLAGQALQRREPLVIQSVPPGYFQIRSALGSAPPAALLVAPLRADGESVGALELGCLAEIPAEAVDLVTRVSDAIATALRSAQYRARLVELLAETQQQAAALQAQQEELRVTNEELEEHTQALRASQAELEQQQAALEQLNASLEQQKADLERARAEAERASHAKSEFLANMSHELRTPLNSALILARQLAEDQGGNLTPEQIRYAETIYEAGNDLLNLINDILDLARVEAGRVDVQPEDVAPAALIEPLRRAFEPVAQEKGLGFAVEIDGGAGTLRTDPQRARQILKNLLSNALKFTSQGEVSLRVTPRPGGGASFAVRDTGVGVAPEHQERIFEAFQQADGGVSRRYGGTGLGLSISRELAAILGGEIRVESAVGEGSTFTLDLPAAALASPAPPRPAAPAPPPRRPARRPAAETPAAGAVADDRGRLSRPGRLILAIEDDPTFSGILRDLVRELDFDCVVAGTAAEGLALARELRPGGIVLDLGLPDSAGLIVLDRLKHDPATRHIPVHVVSAADHTQTALELGAVGYALKPVEREQLVEAIRRLERRLDQGLRQVLVVEDDPRQRESLRALLGGEGVEISEAGTVQQTLALLEQRSFDCMVLDLQLPDGTGYELLERMADGEQYAFPPVIVYTGRALAPGEEEQLRRHSRSIIIKGARSPERLLDEVTLFLHQVESDLPPAQQRMLRDARQREAAFEGRTILLAEDDVRNVFALSGVLEPRGARLVIARNGREALDALGREPGIDLVLMDIMMPEMDGLTAIREIRKDPRRARLPVIALTAKAMADDRETCLAAGANDYLAKPIDIDRLLSLCRVWLRWS